MFRTLKGIDRINSEAFFSLFLASSITKGHSMKIVLPRSKTDVRRYFFLPELLVSGIHSQTMQSAVELLPLFKIMLTVVLLSYSCLVQTDSIAFPFDAVFLLFCARCRGCASPKRKEQRSLR